MILFVLFVMKYIYNIFWSAAFGHGLLKNAKNPYLNHIYMFWLYFHPAVNTLCYINM